jgi:uncharacterized LabA/DUF88 family protein
VIVFVDYDNIGNRIRNTKFHFFAEKILEAIGYNELSSINNVQFRLYGGWYDECRLTRKGQQLAADIQALFPRIISLSDDKQIIHIRAKAELAYSLAADPHKHLLHTYREKGAPKNLRCNSPGSKGCTEKECLLNPIYHLIEKGKCPKNGCSISLDHLVYHGQQKLVDTMMSVDIIHYAINKEASIAIVSSDDDFWPAIKFAIIHGVNVFHVHTLSGRSTPKYYCGGLGSEYKQKAL